MNRTPLAVGLFELISLSLAICGILYASHKCICDQVYKDLQRSHLSHKVQIFESDICSNYRKELSIESVTVKRSTAKTEL